MKEDTLQWITKIKRIKRANYKQLYTSKLNNLEKKHNHITRIIQLYETKS